MDSHCNGIPIPIMRRISIDKGPDFIQNIRRNFAVSLCFGVFCCVWHVPMYPIPFIRMPIGKQAWGIWKIQFTLQLEQCMNKAKHSKPCCWTFQSIWSPNSGKPVMWDIVRDNVMTHIPAFCTGFTHRGTIGMRSDNFVDAFSGWAVES